MRGPGVVNTDLSLFRTLTPFAAQAAFGMNVGHSLRAVKARLSGLWISVNSCAFCRETSRNRRTTYMILEKFARGLLRAGPGVTACRLSRRARRRRSRPSATAWIAFAGAVHEPDGARAPVVLADSVWKVPTVSGPCQPRRRPRPGAFPAVHGRRARPSASAGVACAGAVGRPEEAANSDP
jgi:hypothetical protein